jgi:acyl-CoA dehydrogenase
MLLCCCCCLLPVVHVAHAPEQGMTGGYETEMLYENARVPVENVIGRRGAGFAIAQERLGPGRIFHAMRWLGQMQRAFDLTAERLLSRKLRGGVPLASKQLMSGMLFDSYTDIAAARLMTLSAAAELDRARAAHGPGRGDALPETRTAIAAVKVVGARALNRVIDRAIQVWGAAGLTDDTPLSAMYRAARAARIYDGADEVHSENTASLLLQKYQAGGRWDFGLQ